MALKLYNSLTRAKEELRPIAPPVVGLYTCGPTVYNYQHVGNYRTYVFEDTLKRALDWLGFKVRHVMNITDVGHLVSQADEGEDKMEVGAAREGKTAWEIAKFYTDAFLSDCKELRIQPSDVLCRATDHIKEQIDLISRLERNGYIYKTSDGLYFDTAKFPAYDRLAGKEHIAGLQEGARVEANPEKRRACDFAVWKFSPAGKKRQMEWESPWGVGFPGWHIECSAMAMKFLGETFDIHCGGVDHIPIHHTNEIAQAEAATGKPFVRIWMHGEFLLMNNAKMAKSSGGFITLPHLKEKGYDPLDYRYLCLTAHYRKQLDFSMDSLEAAKTARRRLRDIALGLKSADLKPACADHEAKIRECLSDDLNAPGALAAVWEAVKDASLPPGSHRAMLELADGLFGLGLFEGETVELDAESRRLIDERARSRANKDFASADRLRKNLLARGWSVEDTKEGQKWRKL